VAVSSHATSPSKSPTASNALGPPSVLTKSSHRRSATKMNGARDTRATIDVDSGGVTSELGDVAVVSIARVAYRREQTRASRVRAMSRAEFVANRTKS